MQESEKIKKGNLKSATPQNSVVITKIGNHVEKAMIVFKGGSSKIIKKLNNSKHIKNYQKYRYIEYTGTK